MARNDEFRPIEAARKVERSYRDYIATTIHFEDADLQSQLEGILARSRFLFKGPYIESAPPYHTGRSVQDLVDEGILSKGMLTLGDGDPENFDPKRPLYTHQERAILKSVEGRNFAVVTGTGSGKTECFLLPILNDIFREFEKCGPSAGVRAMILYPMNALANDQLKRLRLLLKGTSITFGRYTGDTEEQLEDALQKWKAENPGLERLPNELISRTEIRQNPPNILLTNYSMLEYLLLRPKDAPLFNAAFGRNWRHIAIDEAHVYSGALGTEIAYLIRRLKARISSETGTEPHLHCYATSATIGSDKDLPKIAQFAQDLFGEPFNGSEDDIDVITSDKDLPQDALDPIPWGKLPLETWEKLRDELSDKESVSASSIRNLLAQEGVPAAIIDRMDGASPLLGLGRILLGESSTMHVVQRCSGSKGNNLLDLTDIDEIESIGIEGLSGNAEGISILTAMIEVLSQAQRTEDVPILTSRYHSFLRAPEGLYINLWKNGERRLVAEKKLQEAYDEKNSTPVYEISVCRHCGQAYILGSEKYFPGTHVPWLDPRHQDFDSDDQPMPRKYYRLLSGEDDRDEQEQIIWLCPICGTTHSEKTGGEHLFKHKDVARIPIALNESEKDQSDELVARCRHCGYQSPVAIQPMRVSPDAAGSVICYDLVRFVPPFKNTAKPSEDDWFGAVDEGERRAGNIICFSDKRQDAAFFAPSLERTYNAITKRQLIREAVSSCDKGNGCSIKDIVQWICSIGRQRYKSFFKGDGENQITAWLLDEMEAEDSRNSLEGLGVIRIEPAIFIGSLREEKTQKVISKLVSKLSSKGLSWLNADDFKTIALVCMRLLRSQGAVDVPSGVDEARSNHITRGKWVVLGDASGKARNSVISFTGSSTRENAFSSFVKRYALKVHGVQMSQADTLPLLEIIYKFIWQYLRHLSESCFKESSSSDRYMFSMDIWRFYKHDSSDILYRCDKCGCETHLYTHGTCTTYRCDGTMHRLTFEEANQKDRYYKDLYLDEALPIDVEEHTAQLSHNKAREVQSGFIQGDVNVLSCTTTFELGVDVGDLRAIFMRNVPPSAANYAQRAGRVGRRAGKPGFAITFAKLRPHDIAFFHDPAAIIHGETPMPACYLDNRPIALRHVFATALSEYFRYHLHKNGVDVSHAYNDFLELADEHPQGLDDFKKYLDSHPESIGRQLDAILPAADIAPSVAGLRSWRWIEDLAGDGNGAHTGRLIWAHHLKHADFARIYQAMEDAEGMQDYTKVSKFSKTLETLKKDLTISVLAENGVLPKYGFPTDLVELHLPELGGMREDSKLSLQRGLRLAIREYAPGSEIVAGKRLWKSVGIRILRGHKLIERLYGCCPKCGTFVWPIDDLSNEGECPVCHTKFKLTKKMLIPAYGFIGYEERKGIGLRRPRSHGYVQVLFSQHWPEETTNETIDFPGGTAHLHFAENAQLCAINEAREGLRVCPICGATATDQSGFTHLSWCLANSGGNTPEFKYYNALGTAFVSDVLGIDLSFEHFVDQDDEGWESVMWAFYVAAASLLGIPENELGATYYRNDGGGISIMLYDNVPGGAGYTQQLHNHINELVNDAYHVVDGHCGCGEETCCYGCIANYMNQSRQPRLSRGAAKRIFEELLGA